MVRYKDIQFIKVNAKGNSKVSERMRTMGFCTPNLKYMYIDEIYTHLGLTFNAKMCYNRVII